MTRILAVAAVAAVTAGMVGTIVVAGPAAPQPAGVAGEGPQAAPPPGGRQGIVLITIDSLRADHVGAYAPGRPTATPALDLLAATGVRFERASAASVSTAPSAASILTGLLPSAHGLRDDHGGRLKAGVRTIADRLRSAGWATAAVVGTDRFGSARGFDAGFDRYDDEIKGLRKQVAGLSKERRAAEVADRALVAFEALPPGKPFFLWLAFHDPHFDYAPEEPQKSAWPSSPYDGEIAAVDAAIGAVTRNVRDRVTAGRLLFVIAGTHGEGLGDRKETGHGVYLNDSTTHVPLLMTPGKPRGQAGQVVSTAVSLLDVVPTLLDFAGLPPVEDLPGVSQHAAIAADAAAPGAVARPGRKESRAAPRRIFVEAAAPAHAYGWRPLFSVTEGTRRVVQGERLEAFDLEADPAAASPLAKPPRWSRELVEWGQARLGSLEHPEVRRQEIDAALAALDPPWAASPLCIARDSRPDPRDPPMPELQDGLFLTQVDAELGLVGYAWKRGTAILEKDPANPTALAAIIVLGLRNHWPDDMVLDPLETLTCQYPYRPEGYHYLGHYYSAKRNWDQAVKAFNLMRLAGPDDDEAEYDLACTYAAMGRKDDAFEHLRRSIEKGSDDFDRMRRDGRLSSLREDPRFALLVPPQNPQ